MNILLVDDEIFLLKLLQKTVAAVVPEAQLFAFSKASQALELASTTPLDIAFLDINMRGITGMELAKQLQAIYPKLNIIFCTGYSEYAMDAHGIHCSGYILKPVDEDKVRDVMANLRYPIAAAEPEEPKKRVQFTCFGSFEILVDGKPLYFKYKKSKELLAYLVDRCGASCTYSEISVALWDDDEDHSYYLKSLRKDLLTVLEEQQCDDILAIHRGYLAVLPDMVSCDYYDWRNGRKSEAHYTGEYMSQYSWAEYTNACLLQGTTAPI